MSDQVQIKGEKSLQIKLKKLPGAVISKEVMSEIGTFLLTSIKVRTAKGTDADGKTFKGYSPGYKLLRSKKGLPSALVDLFFTGSMSSAMTFEAERNKVRLFFLPTTDKSGMFNPEKAYYVNEKRKFFAVNSDEISKIADIISDNIRRTL